MRQYEFYFRRKVTAPVLNTLQGFIQDAIDRLLGDRNITGIVTGESYTAGVSAGWQVSINSGGSDPLAGFTKDGTKVVLDANPYVTPDLSGLFSLPAVGEQKYLTLMLGFARDEQQPETDTSTFTTVYFDQQESFEIIVLEGASAVGPTKPTIDYTTFPKRLYICDILINDTDTDFSTSTFDIDLTRKEIDPLAEAVARGLDGVNNKMAFIGSGAGALRFRDIVGSDVDLEAGLLAMIGAGITGVNRGATLNDLTAAAASLSIVLTGTASWNGPGAGGISAAWPAGVKFILGFVNLVGSGSSQSIFLIDVAANTLYGISGGSELTFLALFQIPGKLLTLAANPISASLPLTISNNLGNASFAQIVAYIAPGLPGAGISLQGVTAGVGGNGINAAFVLFS